MGPTLVVTATKFRLGAEIQSPTGLYNDLLVAWLVHSAIIRDTHCDFSKSTSSIFTKFGTDVQHTYVPNVIIKDKVKVQGHLFHTQPICHNDDKI